MTPSILLFSALMTCILSVDRGQSDHRPERESNFDAKDHDQGRYRESDNASNQQDLDDQYVDIDKYAIYADDDDLSWRCMWDGSGSGDPDRMAMGCIRLSESECLAASHGMKDARCIWRARSHYGMRLEEEEMNEIVVKEVESAERVDLEAHDDQRGGSWTGESESESVVSPKLGCIWDGSGCSSGCDVEAMTTRCGRLSHDMASCEGEEGKQQRCVWSHGQQSEQELVAQLIATGAMQVNVVDVVLGVLFVLSVAMVSWRLYRCWMKRGYIKLAEDPQDMEPLMMHRV